MRRNGVVFGNQTLDTVEEELKYTVVATNIKNVSSYLKCSKHR